MEVSNPPQEDIRDLAWFNCFTFYIHQYEDRDEKNTHWATMIVEELDAVVCRAFFEVTYRDWCLLLQGVHTVATDAFMGTIIRCRIRRTFLINETTAAVKFAKMQKAAKYRHPLTCWILSPEDNLEPIDFRIRSLFSLAVSATSQQDGDPYHPEVEYYYNETADKREPNWDHFLEPQSTTSLCCLVAWTDRASQGLPLCLTIEMCDLSSAPDSVLFQDSSLTQRFWNEHILKKELKIPRTSKHIWPHLDQAFLVLRLTQVETLYFHSIPSWSHDVLQSKFIEHWNGEAVALYSCLPFLLRSLISNVDEYDPEPLAQNHIAEGRELQYPPALRPTMLLFEKEFAECDSHQLLIRRSGCGSNESANIMSSTTSANKIPTIIGSSHNSAYCSSVIRPAESPRKSLQCFIPTYKYYIAPVSGLRNFESRLTTHFGPKIFCPLQPCPHTSPFHHKGEMVEHLKNAHGCNFDSR